MNLLIANCDISFDGLDAEWIRSILKHETSIWSPYRGEARPNMREYDALIITGSAAGIYEAEKYMWIRELEYLIKDAHANDKPMLGICFGAQAIVQTLGGTVEPMKEKEIGWNTIALTNIGESDPIFKNIRDFVFFQFHGDKIYSLPADAAILATNEYGIQCFKINGKLIYGMQFHAEISPERGAYALKARAEKLKVSGIDIPQLIAAAPKGNDCKKVITNFEDLVMGC